MAKIKFGMMMTDARGKLGGQVFSKNRGGSYIRTKVTPSNPRTSAQMRSRSILGAMSIAWNALTAAQIAAWNGAVDEWKKTDIFGDLKVPTGKNLFVKLNKNLLESSQAQILLPPEKQDLQDVSTLSVAATATTFTFSGLTALASGNFQVWTTPPLSAGVSFYKNKLRVIGYMEDPATDAAAVFSAYVAKFGALAAGDNFFLQIRVIGDNGQAGVPIAVRVVVGV